MHAIDHCFFTHPNKEGGIPFPRKLHIIRMCHETTYKENKIMWPNIVQIIVDDIRLF